MIYTLTLNPAVDKEYTVPCLAYDEVLRTSQIRIDPGGKGFNVSRMLKSLGTSSTAVGFVGGYAGELLQTGLEKAGILTDFIKINGESRTNISIIEDSGKHHIKLNEPGPRVSVSEIKTLLKKISTLAKPGDYWVLAGSLPPGVPDDIYAKIIQVLKENDAFAVLDTSGEPLRLGCLEGPFLAKPNSFEASELTHEPAESITDMISAGQKIHQLGVKVVVISAGAKGAIMNSGSDQWIGHAPIIEEHNPIGAGDAMVAGIVWQLAQAGEIKTALRWGLACGAATASQPGTSMASLEIINSLFDNTSIELLGKA
jgi:1-phosphofructokinase family hexose kinase